MKLQKLLYFAHGWHFAFRDQPLLDELIEAWKYGPVVSSLFHEFKDFGSRPILRKAFEIEIYRRNELARTAPTIDKDDDFVRRLLDRIWEVYGVMNAGQLSHIVHRPSSPWTLARRKYALIRNAPTSKRRNASVLQEQEERERKGEVELKMQAANRSCFACRCH